MEKHIVIIGSGLGGLTCGYILAKNGCKVTILEKNAQPGGCLQTFTRRGMKFETGMHYIGSMEEGQLLHNFFRYLNLLSDVKLCALNREAYDLISIGSERFPFANGVENFTEYLGKFFPNEKDNLQKYWQVIREITENSPFYSLKTTNEPIMLNPAHIKHSYDSFLETITPNEKLRLVLAGNLPLYAGERGKMPIYIPAFINNFYNCSAYRIVGGSETIAHSLIKSIRAMGGEVVLSAEVVKLNCDDKKAVSVTIKNRNKETIAGDYFISNMHPARMVEIVESNLLRKSYRDRITSLNNTTSNFTVYIAFKKNAEPYFNSNLYHYESPSDVWRVRNYDQATYPSSFLYMHLRSSENQQFTNSAVLITYMNFDDVAQWAGTKVGRRGADYEEFKREKAEKLLDLLEKQIPGTRSHIEHYYTSSPLTYLDYTGTERGSMYGVLPDCNESIHSLVSQRTRIPNLFQTGQNVNSHGILGVIIGAILTSGELLGVNHIVEQIKTVKENG
ncbi:MAG: NAD(P)/FAD-dependent oxidoreductase [Dysgonamonadaceae bacterium]|jgi:all-trans-retinol 13,14-reductase|nr:NAD(P)/FAD-dependent oxidoreductase [Dysgonamonadaceae bacterium]